MSLKKNDLMALRDSLEGALTATLTRDLLILAVLDVLLEEDYGEEQELPSLD